MTELSIIFIGNELQELGPVFGDNPDLVAVSVRFQIFSSSTQRYVLSEYQPIMLSENRGGYLQLFAA
jgi:hypothetical protein